MKIDIVLARNNNPKENNSNQNNENNPKNFNESFNGNSDKNSSNSSTPEMKNEPEKCCQKILGRRNENEKENVSGFPISSLQSHLASKV